ncbi:replication protein P [Chitiniphilus eburneus]|uniref:replication protein P n=1 Tax=Chitiniphilus eburneus TaxID=2571148 RepID=UPI0035D006A7
MSSMPTTNVWLKPRTALDGRTAITHLFNRLSGMYPAIWRASFRSQEEIDNWELTWAEAFQEDAITPAEVSHGLGQCRQRHDKPPSLTQFLKACRPTAALEPEALLHIAIECAAARRNGEPENWPSPRVFWAAQKMGGDLLGMPAAQLRGRWLAAWDRAAAMQDQPIPPAADPASALPAPGCITLTREEAQQRAAQIGLDVSRHRSDTHRRWAYDIAREPKRYPRCSVELALGALNTFGEDLARFPELLERARLLGVAIPEQTP